MRGVLGEQVVHQREERSSASSEAATITMPNDLRDHPAGRPTHDLTATLILSTAGKKSATPALRIRPLVKTHRRGVWARKVWLLEPT